MKETKTSVVLKAAGLGLLSGIVPGLPYLLPGPAPLGGLTDLLFLACFIMSGIFFGFGLYVLFKNILGHTVAKTDRREFTRASIKAHLVFFLPELVNIIEVKSGFNKILFATVEETTARLVLYLLLCLQWGAAGSISGMYIARAFRDYEVKFPSSGKYALMVISSAVSIAAIIAFKAYYSYIRSDNYTQYLFWTLPWHILILATLAYILPYTPTTMRKIPETAI